MLLGTHHSDALLAAHYVACGGQHGFLPGCKPFQQHSGLLMLSILLAQEITDTALSC